MAAVMGTVKVMAESLVVAAPTLRTESFGGVKVSYVPQTKKISVSGGVFCKKAHQSL